MKSRHKQLGITDDIRGKSHNLLVDTISPKGYASREELVIEYKKAGIDPADNRISHLLLVAELDGLICSGKGIKNKTAYALLEERVKEKKLLSHEESLATLAGRYFKSHGPATERDFLWWSGLSMKDVREGIQLVRGDLASDTSGSEKYWFSADSQSDLSPHGTFLLPAYDEFLISYKDRSASLRSEQKKKPFQAMASSGPLLFQMVRSSDCGDESNKRERILIEAGLFREPSASIAKRVEKAAGAYGKFIGVDIHIELNF